MRRGYLASAAVMAALAVLGAPVTALATEGEEEPEVVSTVPPAEPEETDLLDAGDPTVEEPLPPDVKPPADQPDAEYCSPRNVYTPTTHIKNYHKGVGVTQANYNGTPYKATSTFTATASGTVGVSYTAGLTTSVEAMIAKIEGKFEVNLSASLTASIGNRYSVTQGPYTTVNARYGVWRFKSTGLSYKIYSNCATTTKNTITSYTPIKVGWYVWMG